MKHLELARTFWNDEAGFVVAAEIILILTIGVLAIIVGLSEVAVAVNTELNDISNAIGSINQSFGFTGFHGTNGFLGGKLKSFVFGSRFNDTFDDCDFNGSCSIVCGVPQVAIGG